MSRYLFLTLFVSIPLFLKSQAPSEATSSRIEILYAEKLSFIQKEEEAIQKLIGEVKIKQDSTFFYCDSAYSYQDTSILEAFGNVKIVMQDGVTLTGDRLFYNGFTRIAEVFENIVLDDGEVKLFTDKLIYYRDESYGIYTEGGVLENADNTLTSETGYYYSQRKMAYFNQQVSLVNPDYTLTTDTLGYNTATKVAVFLSPTEINNEDGSLLTSNGNYATEEKNIELFSRSTVLDSSYTLTADTLYYNDSTSLGYAYGSVLIEQQDSSLQIWGDEGFFNRSTDETIITEKAIAIQFMEEDTLYMTADTLYAKQDSVEGRLVRAYYKVDVYMNDMQGKADSLIYLYNDSLIILYDDPIIWSDVNQVTGDTIKIQLKENRADSMWVGPRGFLVSQEDTLGFNQIKGKEMRAKFRENKLVRLHVIGNSESIYFGKDELDNYQGMNTALSQEMIIYLKDNEVSKISFLAKPDGKFFPIHEILFEENKLEGMRWRIDEKTGKPILTDYHEELLERLMKPPPATLPETTLPSGILEER
ncbi:MAG: OstA-like protein [Bacteroidota bacterium]